MTLSEVFCSVDQQQTSMEYKYYSAHWLQIPFSVLKRSEPKNGHATHSQIECHMSISELKPINREDIPPLLCFVLDGEMYGRFLFPIPERDNNYCLGIGFCISRYGQTKETLKKVHIGLLPNEKNNKSLHVGLLPKLSLENSKPIKEVWKDGTFAEWYYDEKELLNRFRDLFIKYHHFGFHYNGVNFDWPYFLKRFNYLDEIKDREIDEIEGRFNQLCQIISHRTPIPKKPNFKQNDEDEVDAFGKKRRNKFRTQIPYAKLEGSIHYDLFRYAKDILRENDLKLKVICEKYLPTGTLGKIDLPIPIVHALCRLVGFDDPVLNDLKLIYPIINQLRETELPKELIDRLEKACEFANKQTILDIDLRKIQNFIKGWNNYIDGVYDVEILKEIKNTIDINLFKDICKYPIPFLRLIAEYCVQDAYVCILLADTWVVVTDTIFMARTDYTFLQTQISQGIFHLKIFLNEIFLKIYKKYIYFL